jgi:hypothetical protein
VKRLLAVGICAALLLCGCGGGSDSASTSSTTQDTTTASTPQPSNTRVEPQDQHESKQANKGSSPQSEGSKQQGNTSSPKKHLKLVKVPAISSRPKAGAKHPAPGVKTVKGGDNSVQEYGVEAGSSERTEAAIALQGYLNARAREDWGAACSLLAKKPMEQLERIQKAAAKQGQPLNGCAATLALLKEGEAQLQEQAQITEVLSFRGEGDISGDPSYLIFTAPPGNTLFSMPMYLQGQTWKVGLARPSELPVG